MAYLAKLPNVQACIMNNTIGAADCVIANRNVILLGTAPATTMNVVIDNIVIGSYVYTAYVAGTAQISTSVITLVVPVAGTGVTYTFLRKDTNQQRSYFVLPTTTVVDDLGALIAAAIQADPGRWFDCTYTSGSDTLTFTQLVDTGGFLILAVPTGATIVYGTPYVFSSGTYAQVAQYGTALAGGQFHRFDLVERTFATDSQNGGVNTYTTPKVIWVESQDAQAAALVTQMAVVFAANAVAAASIEYLANS